MMISHFFFFLMILRPPRSTQSRSSAASDVYKRQVSESLAGRIGIVNLLGLSHGELIDRPAGPFVPENEFLLRRVWRSRLCYR